MKGLDSNQISDKSKEAVYAITYTSWNSAIVGVNYRTDRIKIFIS